MPLDGPEQASVLMKRLPALRRRACLHQPGVWPHVALSEAGHVVCIEGSRDRSADHNQSRQDVAHVEPVKDGFCSLNLVGRGIDRSPHFEAVHEKRFWPPEVLTLTKPGI